MTDKTRAAADLLWETWTSGGLIDRLPDDVRPTTREEGYAVQALLEERAAEPLVGWKIAATSEAGQRHINVSGPIAGRLLAERTQRDGATLSLENNRMRVAEPEFAFRIGRDLRPRSGPYGVDETLGAVDALHLAIEVPDSRYSDFTVVGEAQLIADDACAHEFVLGPVVEADWRSADLTAHQVTGIVNGTDEHPGIGSNVLGDPRVALQWLVNEVTGLGLTLKAGQVVTTGTCSVPIPVGPGDSVVMDFGAFGKVSVAFDGRG